MPEKIQTDSLTIEQALDTLEKYLCKSNYSEKGKDRTKFFAGNANNFEDLINFLVRTTHENFVNYQSTEFNEIKENWNLQEKLIKDILHTLPPFDDKFKPQFSSFLAGVFFALLRSYIHDKNGNAKNNSPNSSKYSSAAL